MECRDHRDIGVSRIGPKKQQGRIFGEPHDGATAFATVCGAVMKKTILIVDDEEIITRTLSRLLEKQGYGALIAAKGEEAVGCAQQSHFDLMLCDILMPGKNGVEVARQIQEIRVQQGKGPVPIIFLTGYADETLEKQAQELKPVAYVFKPFDAFQLLTLIHSKLGEGRETGLP